jgi:SAM-dependent MidA family methyltransferase
MADILRVAELVPTFRRALRIHLVETSARMREVQARTLAGASGEIEIEWHGGYPAGERPVLVVANEFFDVLPVRQYVRHAGRWHERRVGLAGDALAFVLSPPLPDVALGPAATGTEAIRTEATRTEALVGGRDAAGDPAMAAQPDAAGGTAMAAQSDAAPDGTLVEVSPAAEAIMATIAAEIVRCGGALLLIDYGDDGPRPFGTLQAVRDHARADPLTAPGTADLTAHVDFAHLASIARANGAAVHGPLPQGEFLLRLGLLERAGRLGAGKSPEEQAAIERAVTRLAGPDQMGHLFKVMAVTSQNLVPEPFGR